jgi:hypothetical protein
LVIIDGYGLSHGTATDNVTRPPQALITWRERNRHALREFWARAPADALGVKQDLEKVLAQDGKPTT